MKPFITTVLLSLIAMGLNAQKTIEKSIEYTDQHIDIEVKFASDIEIKTWDKSSVYVKAEIDMEEEKYIELFELKIVKQDNQITIGSNSETVFEKIWDDYEREHGKRKRHFCTGDHYEFDYVIHVPRNAKLKVSSINGSLSSEIIEGNLTVDLINGDIEIKKYSGKLDLSTINGAIDLKMEDADLVAETVHGNIYADRNLRFDSEDRHVGQKISGRTAQGKNILRLNTINGDMFLRL